MSKRRCSAPSLFCPHAHRRGGRQQDDDKKGDAHGGGEDASGEASEIFGLMARYGFFKQMRYHSTTSQYGTMTRAKELLNDEIREKARSFLVDDIMGGKFVDEKHKTQI